MNNRQNKIIRNIAVFFVSLVYIFSFSKNILASEVTNTISNFLGGMQTSENLSEKISNGRILRLPPSESDESETVPEKYTVSTSSRPEILVKYKSSAINLSSESGKETAKLFFLQKASEISPTVLQALDSEGKMEEYKNQGEDFSSLQEDFMKLEENINFANISVVSLGIDEAVVPVIIELQKDPNIEYVQPNFQYFPTALHFGTPLGNIDTQGTLNDALSDTYASTLWNLEDGPAEGTGSSNFDIDILKAWKHLMGYESEEGANNQVEDIIVAVIDTGVNIHHPDLKNVLWDSNGHCEYPDGSTGTCSNHGAVFDTYRNDHSLSGLANDDPTSYYSDHGTHTNSYYKSY